MKQKIKCPNCNYEWETKSEMMFITCPNCRKKFDNLEYKSKMEVKK